MPPPLPAEGTPVPPERIPLHPPPFGIFQPSAPPEAWGLTILEISHSEQTTEILY